MWNAFACNNHIPNKIIQLKQQQQKSSTSSFFRVAKHLGGTIKDSLKNENTHDEKMPQT